jgi:hypothetical protein
MDGILQLIVVVFLALSRNTGLQGLRVQQDHFQG